MGKTNGRSMWHLRVQFECGHEQLIHKATCPDITEFCDSCRVNRFVKAIECREWHYKCGWCPFATWNGSSEEECSMVSAVHRRSKGHPGRVKYEINPAVKKLVRDAHSYRVAFEVTTFVPDLPPF